MAELEKESQIRLPIPTPMQYNIGMRIKEEVDQILSLKAQGKNHCEIARELGISRGTVRDICNRDYALPNRMSLQEEELNTAKFKNAEYAYLLGMYLGDGCLSEHPRTWKYRIACCTFYPEIIQEIVDKLALVLPGNKSGIANKKGNCCEVYLYNSKLPELFPTGLGRKHERKVSLEPWQQEVVEEFPGPLLRGLWQADGCAFRQKGTERLLYEFINKSKDVIALTEEALQRLGIGYTKRFRKQGEAEVLAVRRIPEVAKMFDIIGEKK